MRGRRKRHDGQDELPQHGELDADGMGPTDADLDAAKDELEELPPAERKGRLEALDWWRAKRRGDV